jgi:hypothetical protein
MTTELVFDGKNFFASFSSNDSRSHSASLRAFIASFVSRIIFGLLRSLSSLSADSGGDFLA